MGRGNEQKHFWQDQLIFTPCLPARHRGEIVCLVVGSMVSLIVCGVACVHVSVVVCVRLWRV